ncbi:MAG TPA: hypothetical protein VHS03_05575 [Gaiellaceae bacterium]|nr:hypothetical protein [Gaiellaceae bacterium]
MKRLLAAALAAGALAAAAFVGTGTATADSSIPFHARVGDMYGLIPPVNAANGAITNNAPASGSLYYNGGPVMTTNSVYTIYWQPPGYQFPSGYSSNLNQYFKDLQATSGSNTNVYDTGTQYYQVVNGAKQYVQNKSTFAGTTVDTDPLPPLDPVNCPDTPVAATNGGANPPSTTAGCVTDAQLQQEISTVVRTHGWPVNNNTEYFVYTAPNIGTCFPAQVSEEEGGVGTAVTAPLCSFSYFCAYHSAYYDSTLNANAQVIYANMPFAAQTAGNPLTCDEQSYPNGNPSDPEVNVTSHEHNESITDPFGTGWWDSNSNDSAAGQEDGDMCAYDFGNLYGADGAQYNQTINGHHYLMQLEWDNSINGCPGSDSSGNAVPSQPNYSTPAISLSPAEGYATAPFKITGQFFAAGDKTTSTWSNAGSTSAPTTLGSATADASGRMSLMTKVPGNAKGGNATVTTTGKSGSASTLFDVLSD